MYIAVKLEHLIVVLGGTKVTQDCSRIQIYNLYTEEWENYKAAKGHLIPAPSGGCAAAIGEDIFYWCPSDELTDSVSLWKLVLIRGQNGCVKWNEIKVQQGTKEPSSRLGASCWEYARKFWLFGGRGFLPESHELNDHGDFNLKGQNNQLLHFDTLQNKWTNLQCHGDIPSPCSGHASCITGETVWLYGGILDAGNPDVLYQLDMPTLAWTMIHTGGSSIPQWRRFCTLNALNRQLVLHGGLGNGRHWNDTWVLDLSSQSWRIYVSDKNSVHSKSTHTGTHGLNNSVIIICEYDNNGILHVMLEPKSLQKLALKTVFKQRTELPWEQCLPKKLIKVMATDFKDNL